MSKKCILILFLLITIVSLNGFSQKKGKIVNLKPYEFYVLLNDLNNKILIDVRNINSYRNYKIEGAINLGKKKMLKSYIDTLDRETPLFIYCDVGGLSRQACKICKDMEFVNIYNLKGGIYKWRNEFYPVIDKNESNE